MTDVPVNDRLPVASWKVGNAEEIRFPALTISDTMRNRIVAHERPYREGAKLDDTGAAVREFSILAQFSNDIREPGIEENSAPLYPDMLDALQRSFGIHETGDLTLPTQGRVRCRAVSLQRNDGPDNVDAPTVQLIFHQDNEDALDRALVEGASVKGSLPRLAEQTVFSAQADGGWDEALASLEAAVADVDNALAAPGRATNEVEALARRNRRLIRRVRDQQTRLGEEAARPFVDPSGSFTERHLVLLSDVHAGAAVERAASLPPTRAFVVDVAETSLFELAARFNQDVANLLDLNDAKVADPMLLRRGETIRVFVTPPTT